MSSKSNIRKDNLINRIEQSGITLVFPCFRCAQQNKICIKSEISKRCNECVRSGRCKCVDMASSDLAWKKLLRAQEKIEADDDKLNAELEALLAKRARLHKQRKLLRKRAGEFIQTDIKDVEELEKLEQAEEEVKAKQAAEQQKAQELLAALTSQSDVPVPGTNFDLDFDPSVLLDYNPVGIPESSRDSSNA